MYTQVPQTGAEPRLVATVLKLMVLAAVLPFCMVQPAVQCLATATVPMADQQVHGVDVVCVICWAAVHRHDLR